MLYKLSEALINISKKKDACNTLSKLLKEFPEHKLVKKSKKKLLALECSVTNE